MMAFNLFYAIFLCLSCISVPFYLLFLSTIVRYRQMDPFNGSFFKISLNIGICDLISLVNCWFVFRFPLFDWFGLGDIARSENGYLMAKIGVMIAWQCVSMQYLAVATLAFNRLTFRYVVDNVTGDVLSVTFVEQKHQIYFLSLAIFNTTINVATLVMYLCIFHKIHKHRKKPIGHQSRSKGADIKLSFYGFSVFICMVIYTVILLLLFSGDYIKNLEKYKLYVMLWTGVNDTFSCCNPWFIVLFSAATREKMCKIILIKRKHSDSRGLLCTSNKEGETSHSKEYTELDQFALQETPCLENDH